MRCEVFPSAPLIPRQRDEFYSGWSCLTTADNLNKRPISWCSSALPFHLVGFVACSSLHVLSHTFLDLPPPPPLLPQPLSKHSLWIRYFLITVKFVSLGEGDLLLNLYVLYTISLRRLCLSTVFVLSSEGGDFKINRASFKDSQVICFKRSVLSAW
jgi:hypothetical protein